MIARYLIHEELDDAQKETRRVKRRAGRRQRENEQLRKALREIGDIAHRNKRMIFGVPQGPLAKIADIVEEITPSSVSEAPDD